MSVQPTMLASIIGALGNSRLPEDNGGNPDTSRSAGGTDSLIQEAHRFLNELQTPSSRSTKQLSSETSRVYSGSRGTQQAMEGGDTSEEPVPQATGSASAPSENPYREMTIAQKLNRADELLKQYEGTDKYDAFKKRVDAMKHKYGGIAKVAPDAKWNYDEASQAGGQKGLPDLQPNVQIAGSSVNPDYDSTIVKRQNYLDWYSKRGWGSRFVSKLSGQDKQLADTAERAKDDIAYLKGMKNALGYAVANPERARALGALVTPRQFLKDGSPSSNPTSFVWNENVGQFTVVPSEIRIKPREPMQEAQQDAKGGDTRTGTHAASKAGDAPRRTDLSNFLATDEVPETLFGIPIVASPEQYTEADIAFFKEHPRAGGFYELGDEDDEVIEQAGMDVKGTANTEGTADSFELHKSWSGLTPEQQDMNLRILRRARDFAIHDQNYFKKHGDTLGTYYSEAVGVDALKKIGMQFAPGSWKGQPKCNLLIHNVLESVKRGIAPRFGDGNTGYPWTARSWRMKTPPGFIKVENIDDRVPGDIVVGEVLREDGKLEKHAHIGIVAEDRVSSYAAKWDEGAKRYPFPFSDTTSKGKTIKWNPKHTTIIRYIGSPKKGK